jgi:FAD dependent oxidoreductase TIGR03364
MKQFDLAIVGAGIIGLAHAVHAARAGMSVVVFDRSPKAQGASVRNFGMLAVIAQATGAQLKSARNSLAVWQDIAPKAGIDMRQAGCIFTARTEVEMSVLSEFAQTTDNTDHNGKLVKPEQLAQFTPNIRQDTILGGLWSPDAWKVDQREASSKIADWLHRKYSVVFHFDTQVNAVSSTHVETSIGTFKAGHTIICGGNEFAALFPDAFQETDVTQCQLQMLRTQPQPNNWQLKPFVLGGLSIPRYSVFQSCPSLPDLVKHQEENAKDHLKHGIHVIAAQEVDGSITIGDSHAYGNAPDETQSAEIDQLIMDDLAGMITLPDTRIAQRWLGHYAHLSGSDVLKLSPAPNITAVTMTNGQGMTHGFAVAADVINKIKA